MTGSTSYRTIMTYVPQGIRCIMERVSEKYLRSLTEIRLRSSGPVYFVYPDKILFLRKNGALTPSYSRDECVEASPGNISEAVDRLCHYSFHSCTKQLKEGFFVVENGVRVGIAGLYSDGAEHILKEISSLNFRITRNVTGCAEGLFTICFEKNVLICGGVNSGKTTLLRDYCRLTGNLKKVSLIDERNEVACVSGGRVQNDVGLLTDTLVNCSRSAGIVSAVRTLSPDMIFCDEISSAEDSEAILSGVGCGVGFTATAHARNSEELYKRRELEPLLEENVFDYLVFLRGSSSPCEIREIKRQGHGG